MQWHRKSTLALTTARTTPCAGLKSRGNPYRTAAATSLLWEFLFPVLKLLRRKIFFYRVNSKYFLLLVLTAGRGVTIGPERRLGLEQLALDDRCKVGPVFSYNKFLIVIFHYFYIYLIYAYSLIHSIKCTQIVL